jgi:hypothetical protein
MPFHLAACTRASIALAIGVAAFGAINACGTQTTMGASRPSGGDSEAGSVNPNPDAGSPDSGTPGQGDGQDGAVPETDSGSDSWTQPDGSDGSACGVCDGGPTCESGPCGCPSGQSWCGGACVDEEQANANCGGCAIVCSANPPSTAACTMGRCLVTLAAGQDNPGSIAVDTTSVYWTNYGGYTFGRVLKVSTGGGTPITLASAQSAPNGIAVDATNVYWTNQGSNTVMTVSNGGGTATALATGQEVSGGIAVDATSVYWTAFGLLKVPIGGGTPMALASGANGGIALDATSVYWTSGGVMKVSIAGGTPTTLASAQLNASAIAVDATSVYWTVSGADFKSNIVMKVSTGGGAPTALASAQNFAGGGIAVDETSVYWTTSDGNVMKVSTGGGIPATLASGQDVPFGIAVDATSVYWTNRANGGSGSNGGSVMRLTPK